MCKAVRGNQIAKAVNQGMKQVIAVYALIHAAGLNDNSDHGCEAFLLHSGLLKRKSLRAGERKKQSPVPPPRIGETILSRRKELWQPIVQAFWGISTPSGKNSREAEFRQ